jgi:hypothetical protein
MQLELASDIFGQSVLALDAVRLSLAADILLGVSLQPSECPLSGAFRRSIGRLARKPDLVSGLSRSEITGLLELRCEWLVAGEIVPRTFLTCCLGDHAGAAATTIVFSTETHS